MAPGTRQAVSFQSGLRAQGDCWRGAGLSLPQVMWTLWGVLSLRSPLGSCCNPRPCYPAGDWGSLEVGGRGRRITFQAVFFFFLSLNHPLQLHSLANSKHGAHFDASCRSQVPGLLTPVNPERILGVSPRERGLGTGRWPGNPGEQPSSLAFCWET